MISYFGFKLLQGIIRIFPFRILYVLSSLLSWSLQNIFGYRSFTIDKNIRQAYPTKTEKELKRIKKNCYKNLSDTTLESIKGPFLSEQELKKRMVFKNPEIIEQEQFVLLVGGHQGNWEWGGLAVNLWFDQKVHGVYKPMKNKRIDQNFRELRKKWGLNLLSMRETQRWLLEKPTSGILVLIADQSPGNARTSIWTSFYNRDAAFNVGPEKIARQKKCPIYFYSVKRVRRGFYEVTFRLLEKKPAETSEGQITVAYRKALEKSIDEQPEDWLWSHKRWKKTKPEGVTVYT